ncbi:MAG: PKD domain-containing protein, partial [Thermoplasmatota archaeon]
MKWTYIVTLSLLLSFLPVISCSEGIEEPRLVWADPLPDADNDGIPDEFDVLPQGNAVLVISVDELALNGTWDPNIGISLDGNDNGILEMAEWQQVLLTNVSWIEGMGYGSGDLWYGIDIYDNYTSLLFGVSIYNGTSAEDGFFDLSPVMNRTAVIGEFIMRNGTVRSRSMNVSSSGEGDDETGLGDADISVHLEVIEGPQIIEADPPPTLYLSELVTVKLKEGDSRMFRIEDVRSPSAAGADLSFEWYLGFFENLSAPPIEYYCVQNSSVNDTDRFELHANFGSEGLYVLYCIAFMDMERFGLTWFDMKAWGMEVEHHNTVPEARIDVTPSEWITQLDSVSVSGYRSYDRDGDELSFRWFIDGEFVTDRTEFEHVFVDAGLHSMKLEVTDDENVTSVAWHNVTVNNIPVPGDAVMSSKLLGETVWNIPSNFTRRMVDRRSVSTNLELPFGYGLIASFSLVSEVLVRHWG